MAQRYLYPRERLVTTEVFRETCERHGTPKMLAMPANQTNELVHLWAGMYGNVGHLYTPHRAERVRPWLPFALDNGRFSDVKHGRDFDPDKFIKFADGFMYRTSLPRWLVVPDVPFNGPATLEWWKEWEPRLRRYEVPLALALQNGMDDSVLGLLRERDVLFVGGDTEWKWNTVEHWCRAWPRVHVGRVNTQILEKLEWMAQIGVESFDGSGWFRGKSPQVVTLGRFLAGQAGKDPDYAAHCALAARYAAREQLTMAGQLEVAHA